jgi:hypothetical protein
MIILFCLLVIVGIALVAIVAAVLGSIWAAARIEKGGAK